MKKILSFLIVFSLVFTQISYGATQWLEDEPAGTRSVSDIDTYVTNNNDALDRILNGYRRGLEVIASSATEVSILEGEIAIPNAAVTTVKWRETTATTTVTWADIDTGAEAASTYYYIYLSGDTDETGIDAVISVSSSTPTGITFYKKIGWFYNDASSNIVAVGNLGGDAPNKIIVTGTSDITSTSAAYEDMTDMTIYFVSSGKPVHIIFTAPVKSSGASAYGQITIDVDGTDKVEGYIFAYTSDENACVQWLETLTAGTHTIKVQWKKISGTVYQQGSTAGERVLTVTE